MSGQRILITGGSGAIGQRLTRQLLSRGDCEVVHLGRGGKPSNARMYHWDPQRKKIDRDALIEVDTIVHLAGAGINGSRWNDKVRREIYASRVDTAHLLIDTLRELPSHSVRKLVSASGVSYYGLDEVDGHAFVESDPPGSDFLARVAKDEEQAIYAADKLGIRTVMIRTGIALMSDHGALSSFAKPVRFFVGAPLGSGRQWVNWIHVDDLVAMYIRAIKDPTMRGAYNAVAPNPVTNRQLMSEIAKTLRRPMWLPAVPGAAVRLIAGDVAEYVLKGGRVSSGAVERAGFEFKFTDVRSALEDLIGKS